MNKSSESHCRFSIGDCSPLGIAKHLLARGIIESGVPPSDERVKRVARATGYVGDMDALRVAAEREAEYQRALLRVIETDPKISRLLARAGLAARNERRGALDLTVPISENVAYQTAKRLEIEKSRQWRMAADTVFCFQETAKTALLSMKSDRQSASSSPLIRIVRAFRRWLRNLDMATCP